MDLPSTLAAPRICYLAGRVYWVRPLSLEGLATILGWLDDVLPDRDKREMPPHLGAEESQAALMSPTGQILLVWLALRDQGITYNDAAMIDATEVERLRLINVLFARRRSMQIRDTGVGDIAETWCGKGLASMVSQLGMDRVSSLTLDQFEWLCSDGECDMHADPEVRNLMELQKQWEIDHAKWKAEHPEASEVRPEFVIKTSNGEVNGAN